MRGKNLDAKFIFALAIALVFSAGVASPLSETGMDWNNTSAISTEELLLEIKDYVVDNGERMYFSSNLSGYNADLISKDKYYYIFVMDRGNDGIIDEISICVARGNMDLTDKWIIAEGVFERSCKLVPGRDPSILESKRFWDDNIDGSVEMYQFFSVLDYNNPATSDYDAGLVNQKLVSGSSIKDPKFNTDFRELVFDIYEKLIVAPTITTTPISSLVDLDGDGWPDDQEKRAGTNPYNVDTDSDGYWDPQDPNPLDPTIPLQLPTVTPIQPTPSSELSGFEAIFVIVGVLAIAYFLRRRK